MTKLYLGKNSVKTSGRPPSQRSKPLRFYQIHREQLFSHSLSKPRRSFGEKRQQNRLLRKEATSPYSKNDKIMVAKTVMDTDMVNISQGTLFNKMEFPYIVPVKDLKSIHPYILTAYSVQGKFQMCI